MAQPSRINALVTSNPLHRAMILGVYPACWQASVSILVYVEEAVSITHSSLSKSAQVTFSIPASL
ncbi:hypothetical protein FX985_00979 [Pseudomonas extremaustralis]|uniref:Uncharacterized protein n=2 Tax=Pseudomonas TaxID=286 RepID=A0A6L5BNW8_9PSED|nr:hypothetical protein FX984_04956 [Pseudomonas marginalis]KAA8560929.1 hypothetical protein FX985_00979 [Pseudomonas extremaustralis]KAF2390386.1 hypothetical protein FX983_04847 [Pseudomonas frederiksbergensis]